MINRAGELKVADFGISAVLTDSMSRHSMEGKVSGTLSYMSPQQAEGKRPSHLDDIHALGATLYELLSGKPPFFRGNPASIQAQILGVVPPGIAERRADLEVLGRLPVPREWEEAVAACLAKDPAKRPQSAGELLDWVSGRRVVRASPVAASAPPPMPVPMPVLPQPPPNPIPAPLPSPTRDGGGEARERGRMLG